MPKDIKPIESVKDPLVDVNDIDSELDIDPYFGEQVADAARESFKESNPGLHAVLTKYRNHGTDSKGA